MGQAHPKEADILSRDWFYPFDLPGGGTTSTYAGGKLDAIHATRLTMLDHVLGRTLEAELKDLSAIDLACHQGFFSLHLARQGYGRVLGVDARQSHVDDASLIAEVQGHAQFSAIQSDIHDLDADALGRFDVCLMLGLIYHLENPIGAIRKAHALTRQVCLIETQVGPHLSGPMDYGSYEFVRPIKGAFSIIDETDDTHGPEASTDGICLVPSTEALIWILYKVGFDRVELITPPEDAYEQLKYGKRVMVAGFVDR